FSVGTSTLVVTFGNVGIGTTNPEQKLDIQNGGLAISSWTSPGSSLLVSSTTGNVGIGTTMPEVPLHVYQNVNSSSRMLYENTNIGSSVYAGVQLKTDGGSAYIYRTSNAYGYSMADDLVIQDAGGGDIVFFTGEERVRILYGGNVGIGTKSPTKKLDISAGEIQISTSTASLDFMCLAGAVENLPISGYNRGCLIYLTSDNTLYISTETVVGAYSWKPVW
ncbi:MAG: hypothetical protein AB1668_07110, partial [Nanoarchaeota archaeon]